jgi:hypothetical protein
MPAMGRQQLSTAILLEHEEQAESRFVNCAVSLRLADVEELPDGTKRWKEGTDEELIRVGGRWDRSRKRWAGRETKVIILRVHRGQELAARWLARWFRCRITGRWADFRRVWSVLFLGGRRGGKSHLSCVALVLYAAAFPGSLVWAVSPTQEETDELEQAIRSMLPRNWYSYRGGGAGKSVSFRLMHGARLLMLSGHKPRALKRGRVDFAVYNEAQNQHRAGYVQLRGACADRGGLVILAANPPDSPIGRWVEEHYEQTKAGKIESEVFDLLYKDNPWVDHRALESLKEEVDERTYNREVLGLIQPIGDVVFHAWSDKESWRDPDPGWVDITVEVSRRELGGGGFGYVVLMDFQLTPAMCAVVMKVFRDPEFPDDEIAAIVDEVAVEDADEDDLLDALETKGRWTPAGRLADDCYRGWKLPEDKAPVHCAVVMDASAWWQDGAHTKGKTSDKVLRRRRWVHLHKPQKDSDRNPDIIERCKSTNGRLKSQSGRRRLRVARHCDKTARAMKLWENRNGVPYRRSIYAHLCDCVSYGVYRFWGRPLERKAKAGYEGDQRLNRGREMKNVFRG